MSRKILLFFIVSGVIGLLSMFLVWAFWLEMVTLVLNSSAENIWTIAIFFMLAVLILLSLFGIGTVVLPQDYRMVILYFFWSLPVAFNAPNILMGIMWVVFVWISFALLSWVTARQLRNFIEPSLFKLLPGQFKYWLFIFTLILSSSLMFNPELQNLEAEFDIPDSLWQSVWGMINSGLFDTAQNSSVQGVTASNLASLPPGFSYEQLTQQQLNEILQTYGSNYEFSETEFQQIQQNLAAQPENSYFTQFNDSISDTVKTQVETILNDFIGPYREYWPYIIGLTFFLSTQFLLPFVAMTAIVLLELVVWTLLKLNIISLREEVVTAKRYVVE